MLIRSITLALLIASGQAIAQNPSQPAQPPPGALRTGALQPDHAQSMSARAQVLVPSEWVLGAKVINTTSRDKIGTVKDLALSSADGRVEYAIVSRGGVLGVGEKLVAVPWDALGYESKDRVLALGFTEDQLKNAPEFKDEQWPMIGEKTWSQKVHDFFGPSKMGKADTDRDQSLGMESKYQNLIKNGQRTTVRGVVKSIDNKSPGEGLDDACIVMIADQGGQDRIVHLGPSWFVKHQKAILKTGDTVEIQGIEITCDGRDVVAARVVSGPSGSFAFRDDQGRPAWDASSGSMRTAMNDPSNPIPGNPADPNVPKHNILGSPEVRAPGIFVKASSIKGQDLRTGQGEDAGAIKDFVMDTGSGRVACLVVAFGGFLGMGEDRVAVPWSLFTVNTQGKLVLSDINKDQLKAAPPIKGSDWSQLSDPAFIPSVYHHFGRDADWTTKH